MPVHNLVYRDFTIECMDGFGTSNGGPLSLNYAVDCLIENVTIRMNTALLTANGIISNGIAVSNFSSGVMRNCLVDGAAKPGIYLSGNVEWMRLEGCEARNVSGPLGNQPGFLIAGAKRVVMIGCQGHLNQGAGLVINTQIPPNDIESTDIEVVGCQFHFYGLHGIGGGSLSDAANLTNRHIKIIGCATNNNAVDGIQFTFATHVVIADHTARENGSTGITLNGTFNPSRYFLTHIKIIDPHLYDNGATLGVWGSVIMIRSATHVTIKGGEIFNTGPANKKQFAGIRTLDRTGYPSKQLYIQDVQVHDNNQDYIVEALAAETGHFAIRTNSDPFELPAPVGSHYTDLDTGTFYMKRTDGWKSFAFV